MIRDYEKRDAREIIRLVIIGFIAIVIYLCFTYSTAYGYENPQYIHNYYDAERINWKTDTWLRGDNNLTTESWQENFFNYKYEFPANNFEYGGTEEDGKSIPNIPEPAIVVMLAVGIGSFALYRKIRH